MMPLSMFRSRAFSGVNLLTLFLYAALGATTFVLPFTLIQLHGYTVVKAAAALLPFVVIMATLSPLAGRLADRYGPRLFLFLGPTIAAIGFFLFRRATSAGSYWTIVFPAVLLTSLGVATTVAPLTTTVMTSVPEGHVGVASGINNATSRIAMLLAVAIAGILSGETFATGLAPVSVASSALSLLAAVSGAASVKGKGAPDRRRT